MSERDLEAELITALRKVPGMTVDSSHTYGYGWSHYVINGMSFYVRYRTTRRETTCLRVGDRYNGATSKGWRTKHPDSFNTNKVLSWVLSTWLPTALQRLQDEREAEQRREERRAQLRTEAEREAFLKQDAKERVLALGKECAMVPLSSGCIMAHTVLTRHPEKLGISLGANDAHETVLVLQGIPRDKLMMCLAFLLDSD